MRRTKMRAFVNARTIVETLAGTSRSRQFPRNRRSISMPFVLSGFISTERS